MPHKDPIAKRLYMREYLRKRRQDPEFRRIANQRTVASRQNPTSAKKHAESNARYKELYPNRVKDTMRRVDQSPKRLASRVERRNKWLSSLTIAVRRAWEKSWRDARKLKAAKNGGTCTLEQWLDRCRLYGNNCAYCGTSLERKAEMEHIIPVARGGTGWPSNLAPACRSCNAHKSTARWLTKLPKPKTSYFSLKAPGQTMPRMVTKES